MEKQNYRVISFEGGDQVGKGDALNFFSKEIVEREDIDIVCSSFPIYGTPIGNTIKVLLKEGGKKFALDHREELEVKMSLFALNRLEFLEVFLSEDIPQDSLILFDRSAFSSALTIGYAMKEIPGMTKEEVEELVRTALSLDALLIRTLDLTRCVVQPVVEDEDWSNARGGEIDLHEDSEVQRYANYVYSVYEEIVGDGWKRVPTKEGGKWREREDIFDDIYSFALARLGPVGTVRSNGRKFDVGIREIMENIYVGSTVEQDLLDEYVSSIINNDKDLMYLTSIKVKEQICSSYERIVFKNQAVREAFKEILFKYSRVEDALRYNLGAKFINKLTEGLRND